MKFRDTAFSRIGRYAIGVEENSGKYFLSIPVTNHLAEGDEYYEITPQEFEIFDKDIGRANELADRCRQRLEDSRLMYQPFLERGFPS